MQLTLSRSAKHLPMAELLLLLVAIVWGSSYALTKETLVYVSVLAFLSLRFLLSFIVLSPLLMRDLKSGASTDWPKALITGAILLTIFLSEIYGLSRTSAANAAFLISLFVLFTPFLQWLTDGQYPGHQIFILALCSVGGIFLLTWQQQGINFNTGDALILIAALLRALLVICTKSILHNAKLTLTSLTAIQSATVGVGALTLLLITNPQELWQLPAVASFWLNISYLVVFCTLFAFFAQNYALKKTSACRVSLLMGSEPIFGALFAMHWLGESFNQTQFIGAFIIMGCIFYATLRR